MSCFIISRNRVPLTLRAYVLFRRSPRTGGYATADPRRATVAGHPIYTPVHGAVSSHLRICRMLRVSTKRIGWGLFLFYLRFRVENNIMYIMIRSNRLLSTKSLFFPLGRAGVDIGSTAFVCTLINAVSSGKG